MTIRRTYRKPLSLLILGASALAAITAGCAGGFQNGFDLLGFPIFSVVSGTQPGGGGGGGTDTGDGGFFDDGSRQNLDPCEESEDRKFVTISMRSLVQTDIVHYFLILIAFPQSNTVFSEQAAVCDEDLSLYTSFGYTEVAGDQVVQIGDFCFPGPLLFYFHEAGAFRNPNGEFASAIGPALGTQPTYDNFFTSSGAMVPVPNVILFHNPGTGQGAALKISRNRQSCAPDAIAGDPDCNQDSFYYVDDNDRLAGSAALGSGSGRRVLSEVQGTGCECGSFDFPFTVLAPSGATGSTVNCNEFVRGGRIDYVFIRDDRNPPIPQALWQVIDEQGSTIQEFDPRADIP
jgi:hypothetical protein